MVAGGAPACGHKLWGLNVGARADALVVNSSEPALLGVPDSRTLDATIFSSPSAPFADVMVGGRWVIRDGAHAGTTAIAGEFVDAMRELWADVL
jgi:formimidoylglutamate deiminase